jgi:hypothetical protein
LEFNLFFYVHQSLSPPSCLFRVFYLKGVVRKVGVQGSGTLRPGPGEAIMKRQRLAKPKEENENAVT